MSGTGEWRLLPVYLVRLAGFAFERLDRLRSSAAADAAAVLLAAESARSRSGASLEAALGQQRYAENPAFDDPATRKELAAHIKRARAFARKPGGVERPDAALSAAAALFPSVAAIVDRLRAADDSVRAAAAAYQDVFVRELEVARSALRNLYREDPRLRESVFLENPAALDRLIQLLQSDEGARNVRARQRERLATLYAQRFCAKNDTNSICGPHGVGWIGPRDASAGPARPPRIAIEVEEGRRESYFSHWAAERLLACAAVRAGESAVVPVRVNPTASLQDDAVAWCSMEHDSTSTFRRAYARADLTAASGFLLRLLSERPRVFDEVAAVAAAELEVERDEIDAFVDQLARAGLVDRAVVLPPGSFRPLRAVAREVERWPAGDGREWALTQVERFEELVAAFARAGLDERRQIYDQLVSAYEEATQDRATRGEGKHYVDRAVIHEDCFASVSSDLGSTAEAAIESDLPVLLRAVALPLELAREQVATWFRARFGEGRRISALEAHRAFDLERAAEQPLGPRGQALTDGIARVQETIGCALNAGDAAVARVASDDLARAVDGLPAEQRSTYVSADVMLAANPGGAVDVVMGEMHGFCFLPTCLLDVLPPSDRDRAVACMRETIGVLAGGHTTAECLFLHTQATDRRFALGDIDLELMVPSDRPDPVRLGELEVELRGERFRFCKGEREIVPIVAYTAYPFFLYTSPLAPLLSDFTGSFFPPQLLPEAIRGADAPRLAMGPIVFRRRTWVRSAAELRATITATSDADLFLRGQVLRCALGCDQRVFASLPGEPKPVLLDFADFFLVEVFAHLVDRQAPDARIRFTEMLPGPDQLVATGSDGLRTSEIRMGLYRTARSGP
ncbi:MAG TPA: hypothetical protein VK698_00980 [Kofleriaceae bacterium]|nr:hypothetical protein [Kofleriaceae bacterium]